MSGQNLFDPASQASKSQQSEQTVPYRTPNGDVIQVPRSTFNRSMVGQMPGMQFETRAETNPFAPPTAVNYIPVATPDITFATPIEISAQVSEQKINIQPGQIYTAERQDPKPLNRDTWKIDWNSGIMAGILAVGSLALDTAKEWGKQGAQYAAKQISTGAKQLGNSLDMSALMGFKPAAKDQTPIQTVYSTPEQHLKVAAYGTAEVAKPEAQMRNLTNTRNKLQKLMQEGKHAKTVLQKDDRRIGEAMQAIHDVQVAKHFRASRKVSKQELQKIADSDHDILRILAIRDEQRNGGKQAMPELQPMSQKESRGMMGKVKKKMSQALNAIGVKGSHSERGGAELTGTIGS